MLLKKSECLMKLCFGSLLLVGILLECSPLAADASVSSDGTWHAQWIRASVNDAEPVVVIRTARYGAPGQAEKQVDVSQRIRQSIDAGNYRIQANNQLVASDPAYGIEKTLELEYTVDGVLQKKSVQENASIDLITIDPEQLEKDAPPKGANLWSCFRKTISLDQVPTKAQARISADSKYWLWINGERVVFEGQLKRGPTPQDTYFDRVDLKGYLKKGENTIAVLLWYFGKSGFSHNSSGQAGLLFDAEIDGDLLLSGASWKAIIHPAYENTGAPHPNFRLPESNLRFDARKDIVGWELPNFDDSGWPVAELLGQAPCAPWNRLVERPIPLWKDFGLKEYVNAEALPKVSDGSVIKAKLPYNAQITPYLKVEGPAGQLIDIRMDNGTSGRAEYVSKEGGQAYESLGWLNGHEVHYTIPKGFKILELKYRETGYDTEFVGSFKCDDDFFNRHRQKALRTLYINMRDTYMDCPDRERAQWWGDVVNQLGEAFYALDTRSYALAKKGMLELINWQRDDHVLFAPIPGTWTGELKMQMLNSIGYYGFWTYYLYTGDIETLRTVYPGVKRYLSIWQIGEDGLVVPRGDSWTDWGENRDTTVLYNGWYYLALKAQRKMALALGETGDLPDIEARMQSLDANFNRVFWTGTEYRSPDYKDQTDDRAQALAVLAGFAKPEQYEAIREVLRTQEHASPYLEKYVGEALYQMGFAEDALERTRKRFQKMTDHPYTTLWEIWNRGTINHAWSGGALTLLAQYGAGVCPTSPGYADYQIRPQMGSLNYIEVRVPTVKGFIDVELRKDASSFKLQVNSPKNTVATISIPQLSDTEVTRIEVNDTQVWEDGHSTKDLSGLEYLGVDDGHIQFQVQPGEWMFRAQ